MAYDADGLSVFGMENKQYGLRQIVRIKQIQAWHKPLFGISGCIKLKTNYQLIFLI